MMRGLALAMQEALGRLGQSPMRTVTGGEVVSLAVHGIWQLSWLVGPMALAALVSTFVAAQAQGGLNIAAEGLRLDLTRLNPANGLKKLAPSKAGLDLVILVLALLALPLPPVILDLLLSIDIALSVVLLLTAVYIRDPMLL